MLVIDRALNTIVDNQCIKMSCAADPELLGSCRYSATFQKSSATSSKAKGRLVVGLMFHYVSLRPPHFRENGSLQCTTRLDMEPVWKSHCDRTLILGWDTAVINH